ncbi:MAG TPA: hypothetical protein VK760_06790 [Candidatus Acidoferrales bacterium]|jgi:hypothetical protein|nr:hypothetical protein [Candidatus Acidoferrales bacterium]
MAEVILYFGNDIDTMIATKALRLGGVKARVIPRPPSAAATLSHLCLTVDADVEANAKSALAGAGVELRAVTK